MRASILRRAAPDTFDEFRISRPVRATKRERTQPLPGDELIVDPVESMTFAVTIRRPPGDVWPWLAQMGAGSRGGWYSYDFIDNGRRPSAERIVPELQRLTVGLVFPALPAITEGFVLLSYECERSLVLGWPGPDGRPVTTWAFVIKRTVEGGSRLIVRNWVRRGYSFHGLPLWMTKLGHFVMQRKQLLGIARRAESYTPASA
jgi:hypothetical protein